MSCFPLRGLDKSRGDFTHVEIVSATDTKKRPEIDVLPQDENIFETIFLIVTRTNTNPNDTEANAAGRSVRACVARKSKS